MYYKDQIIQKLILQKCIDTNRYREFAFDFFRMQGYIAILILVSI